MTAQEKSKEGTDDFQPEWDTDTFEGGGFDGLERDKRGELAILLPDSSRTTARLQGLTPRRSEEVEKNGEAAAAPVLVEKGSVFSGVLRDEEGTISIEDALTQGEAAQEPGEESEPAKEAVPGEQVAPGDEKKLGVMDFDLDFGPPTERIAKDELQETMPIRPQKPEPTGTRAAPACTPHDETMPIVAPDTPTSVLDAKRDIRADGQAPPEPSSAPIIIKGPKPEAAGAPEDVPTTAAPPIHAHSYLEGESVVEGVEAKVQRPPTKKRMKLPKRVKEKKTRLPLVVLMILLFLVLAGVLAVQHVPEAGELYEKLLAEVLGSRQAADGGAEQQPTDDFVAVEVGSQKVLLKKGADLNAAVSYASTLRKLYAAGRRTKSGKEH